MVIFSDRDAFLISHLAQHDVAPRQRSLGIGDRVIGGWVGDYGRQQCGLSCVQLGSAGLLLDSATEVVRVAAKIDPRCRFDPVGTIAEIDRVEVFAENLLFRPLAREVVGKRRFAQLLRHRPLILGVERVLYKLLSDCGAALTRASRNRRLNKGAQNAAWIDAVIFVEALVFDRDHGITHER